MNLPPDQEERLRRWLAKSEADIDAEAKRLTDTVLSPANLGLLGRKMWEAMEPEVRRLFDDLGEQMDDHKARIMRLERLLARLGRVVLDGDT